LRSAKSRLASRAEIGELSFDMTLQSSAGGPTV
jgi:hypothetical protein